MKEILNLDVTLNVVISEDGRRLWVCDEEGTIIRAKVKKVMLDDRRTIRDNEEA